MAYVVVTRRRVKGDSRSYETAEPVATLDKAREAAKREACRDHGWKPQDVRYHLTCEAIYSQMGESGGTVGPLPDGTVIEVTRA